MEYKISEGNYNRMGVTREKNTVVFTFQGEKEDACFLVLADKADGSETRIEVPREYGIGSLRSIAVSGLRIADCYYCYEINGKRVQDPYAPVIVGREVWNDSGREKKAFQIYGAVSEDRFDWKGDRSPEYKRDEMILYKLHVRGFSMDRKTPGAGTFAAVEQKIPYLKKLGITTVELMPVYEFEEMELPVRTESALPDYVKWDAQESDRIAEEIAPKKKEPKINFWGYGPGNYFAVKASYAKRPGQASAEFKHLVRELHKNGLECVTEMFFPADANHNLILDALRYWVREYHVDGFHLLGENLPMTAIIQDIFLSRTKLFYTDCDESLEGTRSYERLYVYREEYEFPARKILNHINGNLQEFFDQQKKQGVRKGYVNYLASNNGFTLADVFMYDDKHNEANGENNLDGNVWNFSSNYGVEGPTKKKFINAIRERQWRNAMLMLFLAQGVPLLWSGDEAGNSQQGNNNAYCQDNAIGWINWKNSRENAAKLAFVQKLAAFRRKHTVLSQAKPFEGCDYRRLGLPDLSCHGESAWISHIDGRMAAGIMYSGQYAPEGTCKEDVYVAYNFYTDKVELALPKPGKDKSWYLAIDSAAAEPFPAEPVLCERQQYIPVEAQSICVLIGM